MVRRVAVLPIEEPNYHVPGALIITEPFYLLVRNIAALEMLQGYAAVAILWTRFFCLRMGSKQQKKYKREDAHGFHFRQQAAFANSRRN
jgi:hypothetical protein